MLLRFCEKDGEGRQRKVASLRGDVVEGRQRKEASLREWMQSGVFLRF